MISRSGRPPRRAGLPVRHQSRLQPRPRPGLDFRGEAALGVLKVNEIHRPHLGACRGRRRRRTNCRHGSGERAGIDNRRGLPVQLSGPARCATSTSAVRSTRWPGRAGTTIRLPGISLPRCTAICGASRAARSSPTSRCGRESPGRRFFTTPMSQWPATRVIRTGFSRAIRGWWSRCSRRILRGSTAGEIPELYANRNARGIRLGGAGQDESDPLFRRSADWQPEVLRQPQAQLRLASLELGLPLRLAYEGVQV